jgi:prepilin-type N-terminal cleavage/methylation domain-containing protein
MTAIESRRPLQRGLTLIELLLAMTVAGILMAAAFGIFLVQQKTYAVQDQVADIQQNARVAMNLLARDLRMAGHGRPGSTVTIGGTNHSNAVAVDADGGGMTLLGCFGAPEGYLSKSAGIGATDIYLVDSNQATKFNNGERGYVFIGGYDKGVIDKVQGTQLTLKQGLRKRYPTTFLTAAVSPGATRITVDGTTDIQTGDILSLGDELLYVTGTTPNTIDFDTDPTTPFNDPLKNDYRTNTLVNPIPVYRAQALRYDLEADGMITREDLAGGGKQPLAENIQTLTISPQVADNPTYQIVLTARTDVPDDSGRRLSRTYRFTVACRNF